MPKVTQQVRERVLVNQVTLHLEVETLCQYLLYLAGRGEGLEKFFLAGQVVLWGRIFLVVVPMVT